MIPSSRHGGPSTALRESHTGASGSRRAKVGARRTLAWSTRTFKCKGLARHAQHSPRTCSRGRLRTLPAKRVSVAAVPPSSTDALDLLVAQPVFDLIVKSAGDAATHIDNHIISSVANALGETMRIWARSQVNPCRRPYATALASAEVAFMSAPGCGGSLGLTRLTGAHANLRSTVRLVLLSLMSPS